MICILTALLVLACARTEETNRNANATAPAAQVGVVECDSFINSYENCISTKVPEANRAQFSSMVNTWRTDWKKLADNPQTRPTLVNVCKTQLENARTQMKAYGCTF